MQDFVIYRQLTSSHRAQSAAELMTGGSLADAFRLPQEFSVRRSLEIAVDTARGLAYMHNKKPNCIIHRDLKPGNLMISGSAYHELCVHSS